MLRETLHEHFMLSILSFTEAKFLVLFPVGKKPPDDICGRSIIDVV